MILQLLKSKKSPIAEAPYRQERETPIRIPCEDKHIYEIARYLVTLRTSDFEEIPEEERHPLEYMHGHLLLCKGCEGFYQNIRLRSFNGKPSEHGLSAKDFEADGKRLVKNESLLDKVFDFER